MPFQAGVVVLVLLPAIALSQSLGEAAKREKERRKGQPVQTYGDDELKSNRGQIANPVAARTSPSPSPGASPRPQPTPNSQPIVKLPEPSPSPSPPVKEEAALGAENEARWRQRARSLSSTLADLQQRVKKLEDEIAAMERDLGYQVWITDPQVQSKRLDLPPLRRERDEAQRAWDAFEEEARRASVPPGWLR